MKLNSVLLTLFLTASIHANASTAYVGYSFHQSFITSFDPATGRTTKLAAAGLDGQSFVVSPDGTRAYVVGYDAYSTIPGAIYLVDLTTGKVTGTVNPTFSIGDTNLVLSADGSLLYFVSESNLVILNSQTQTVVAQIPLLYPASGGTIAVTPNGSTIYVTSGYDVQAFDGITYQPITISGLPQTDDFEGLALSPDGTRLYVTHFPAQPLVSIVDTATNKVVGQVPQIGHYLPYGSAVSPDGGTLYLALDVGLLRISTATDTVIDLINTPALDGQITPSPDGMYVYVNLAGDQEHQFPAAPGLLRVDLASENIENFPIGGPGEAEQIPASGAPVYVLQAFYRISAEDPATLTFTGNIGPATGMQALIASSNGSTVAGVSQSFTSNLDESAAISVVDTSSNKVSGQFTYLPPAGATVFPFSLGLNSAGTQAYLGINEPSAPVGKQAQAAVLNLPSGAVAQTIPIYTGPVDFSYTVQSLQISPDASSLISLLGVTNDVTYWNEVCRTSLATLKTGTCLQLHFTSARPNAVSKAYSFAFSPDGAHIFVPVNESVLNAGGVRGYLIEADLQTMTIVHRLQLPSVGFILCSAANNSLYVIGGGYDSTSAIYRIDLASLSIANTLDLKYQPTGFAITPDGSEMLVTGSNDGTQVFNAMTFATLGLIPGGPQQSIVIPPQ